MRFRSYFFQENYYSYWHIDLFGYSAARKSIAGFSGPRRKSIAGCRRPVRRKYVSGVRRAINSQNFVKLYVACIGREDIKNDKKLN
jgi:hypothetical protein